MAMTVTTWTDEMVAHAVERIRAVGLRAACDELGKTEASVRSMLRDRRIDWRSPGLPTPSPVPFAPPSGGVDVSNLHLDWRGSRPSTADGFERRVVLGDLHIPAHSASALACAYAVIRALQPHRVIQVGDLVNGQAFSHHGRHSPDQERWDLTLMAARAFIRSVKQAAPGAELWIVRGNHDDWASRYEAENPDLQGAFDLDVGLGLKRTDDDSAPPMFDGVHVVRRAESNPLILGPVAYAHGNGGGMHFAKRYAETLCPRTGVRAIRVGHHHTLQVYRHRNGCECSGVGWLGNEDHPAFHYAPPPRGWWVGLTIEDVCGDTVTTTYAPIVNGKAVVLGRVVSA